MRVVALLGLVGCVEPVGIAEAFHVDCLTAPDVNDAHAVRYWIAGPPGLMQVETCFGSVRDLDTSTDVGRDCYFFTEAVLMIDGEPYVEDYACMDGYTSRLLVIR